MERSWIAERSGNDAAAIAAREADIIGNPQRIAPLDPEQLSGDARDLIDRIRISAGAKPAAPDQIPGYFLTMVRHPEIFRCQLEMGTAIFQGEIPARERELAVLRIGWLLRAPYEWGQHVAIGKRYGLTTEDIERIVEGADAPGWNAHDAAILRAVDALLADQSISDSLWAALAQTWNERQLIEFTMLVGQYVATAFVQNALRIQLSPENPGLSAR